MTAGTQGESTTVVSSDGVDRQMAGLRDAVGTRNMALFAIFLSGVASLVYETVWQRALKVYLAGSEAISALLVVLVFMLGMGLGALAVGLVTHRVRRPILLLAGLEFSLCAFGLLVAFVLGLDIAETIYSIQRLGLSIGLPLRMIYAFSAAVVLLPPCLVMGMTLPLASEIFQRQMGYSNPSFVAVLFFISTGGAVFGATSAGFVMLPLLGQRSSMSVAIACNAVAGLVLLWVHRFRLPGGSLDRAAPISFKTGRITREEALGFGLGFLSLAYEMYLFRVVAVAHRPLPYNFALVLSLYLLFWSLGAYVSERKKVSLRLLLPITAAIMASMPVLGAFDLLFSRRHTLWGLDPVYLAVFLYTAPCLLLGWLFGIVVSNAARKWGKDVGRFYGLNTLGSCLGVLAMTVVGYEFNHAFAPLLISLAYLCLDSYVGRRGPDVGLSEPMQRWGRRTRRFAIGLSLSTGALFVSYDLRPAEVGQLLGIPAKKIYYGIGGVIEVSQTGDMTWDGLWHSALSRSENHIGTSNWLLATVPLLAHLQAPVERALVIGLGTGITASTLARSTHVKAVDAYETNTEVRQILQDYPAGTLGAISNPKIMIHWQDGRAGLALNSTRYDLITQQPLWLIQAGSSFLLSREYMELVRSRLRKNGVFCVYSHSYGGNFTQAQLVRRTAASVFKHTATFGGGYMVVASDEPIVYAWSALSAETNGDRVFNELRAFGIAKMAAYVDRPDESWRAGRFLVTDDHPLIEYPWFLAHLTGATLAQSGPR